jgi:hypothetical protein
MVDILDSIDSNNLGMTVQGAMPNSPRRLLCKGGFVSGPHGRQAMLGANPFRAAHFDDFLGNALSTFWTQQKGSNNPAAPAPLSGGIGGVLQIVTGAAGTGLAADENSVVSSLQFQANMGELDLIARVKLSAVTNVWAFIGFTDVANAVQIPLQWSAADTIVAVATNAFGLLYDDRMTTKKWWLCSVNAGGTVQQQVCTNPVTGTLAPTLAQNQTVELSMDATGKLVAFINGVQMGSGLPAAVGITTPLAAILACGKTSGASANNMQVDMVGMSQLRGLDNAAT